MKQQKASRLYDRHTSVAFYEERYTQGYMHDWPTEKKQRILEVLSSLDLPTRGEALDFGCGNGVLTDVIRQALPPEWKVYGTDISAVAIENAKKRYPTCTFFVANDKHFSDKRFDFLFTHHVLEHVFNLHQTLSEVSSYLKAAASAMLHILPCGNEGSFEHNVCLLRKDGINSELEGRFFFEDEGHVRRLTTEQLSALCMKMGFVLTQQYYSNQYFGAINWITQSGPSFLRMFTDTSQALDKEAESELKKLRYQLLGIWALRYPVAFVESRLRKVNRSMRDYIFLIMGLPMYVFTKPVDTYIKVKVLKEWETRKMERNGSEMYLFFKR